MRILHLVAAAATALTVTVAPAAACCHRADAIYRSGPFVPPDAIDPWYPVRQVYVVNQGPVFTGPGIYAYRNFYIPSIAPVPYWEGGYPYSAAFPYVRGEFDCHGGVERCYYGYRRYWRAYAAYHHRVAPGAQMVLPRRYHGGY